MKDFQEQIGVNVSAEDQEQLEGKVNAEEQKKKRRRIIHAGLVALVPAAIVAAIVTATVAPAILSHSRNSSREPDFNTIYHQALIQYADVNPKDGFVTAAEQDAFDRDLLEDKGVTLIRGTSPRYTDGSIVPTRVITQWILDYKPSEGSSE